MLTSRYGMIVSQRNHEPVSPRQVPEDLREWVRDDLLLQLVLQSVWEVAVEYSLKPIPQSHSPCFVSTEAILIYSYAVGLYSSQAIEHSVPDNGILQQLCEDRIPSSHLLRHFRRDHKDEVQETLRRVIQKVWRHHCAALPTASPCSDSKPAWLDTSYLQWTANVARERIMAAITQDSMDLDE